MILYIQFIFLILQEIIEKVERNVFMSTIFKELTEKLYHPIRLEKYLEKYGIDMNDEYDFFIKVYVGNQQK
jgi:hypothetical protein